MGWSRRLTARLSPTPIGETTQLPDQCIRGQGSARAFTLVELLVAVGLIVIISAVSFPMLDSTIQGYRVRTSAWQVAGDIRLARAKAVSTSRKHRICFSNCRVPVPTNGYLVQRKEGPDEWVVESAVQAPAKGVRVTSNHTITFDEIGEADQWGTVTLESGSASFQVKTAITGRVRVCKEPCS